MRNGKSRRYGSLCRQTNRHSREGGRLEN